MKLFDFLRCLFEHLAIWLYVVYDVLVHLWKGVIFPDLGTLFRFHHHFLANNLIEILKRGVKGHLRINLLIAFSNHVKCINESRSCFSLSISRRN